MIEAGQIQRFSGLEPFLRKTETGNGENFKDDKIILHD